MTKKKIAILFGGRSVEHGVSINSARNIAEYIDKQKFELVLIGISTSGTWHLVREVSKEIEKGELLSVSLTPGQFFLTSDTGRKVRADVVFPVLHGTDGEDGSIQGLIKALDVPMVGTGVLGSAMSMSKLVTKRLLGEAGIPVADFLYFFVSEKQQITFEAVCAKLGLPFMVKSASLGSSVGVSKVKSEADFATAIEEGFRYDDCILIEKFIKGREVECAIMGNYPPQASLPGEIVISKEYDFYTFDAKYVDDKAVSIEVPAKLDPVAVEKIRQLSLKTYQSLACEDFARVDLFLTDTGDVYVNEINTIPGFTNSSMFPMMWRERGVSFTELITKLIGFATERFEKTKRAERNFNSALKF
ncbi:MAG: D-alanine--D-alanine ligase family protein [Cytophagales bacterium]